MADSIELVDILTEDGRLVGVSRRDDADRRHHIFANVLVFIFTSQGQFWQQKRALTKKHFPGLWEISACGAVKHGETPLVAAQREQLEEMGYTSKLHHAETFLNRFLGPDGMIERRLSHIFIGIDDRTPIVTNEVEKFRIADCRQTLAEATTQPDDYVPSFADELRRALSYADSLF